MLKLRHYGLLAYWVYFRPTALKCYLYQTLPELYNPESSPGLIKRWSTPAYWNLFLMLPILSGVLALFLSLPVSAVSAWGLDVSINLERWRDGLMFGVAVGVTFGMALGMVGRVLGGPALGTLMGIIFSITLGVLGGTTMSAALGIRFANLTDAAVVVSAIFGLLSGMAVTLDIEIGIAVSLTFLTIGAISFGAEFVMYKIFGVRFGALLARGMMSGAFVAGAFRVLWYPFEFILALFSVIPAIRHPLEWDELAVLPLPWTRWMLLQYLRKDETDGLHFVASVWRNLFCRPAIQVVLYRYINRHSNPLRLLYSILSDPQWDRYMLVPVTPQQWQQNTSVRRVLLGEFALKHVEATQNPRFHRSSWWLNLHVYPYAHTSITRFAGMLHDFMDEQSVTSDAFALSQYADIYTSLSSYPGGTEITASFEVLAKFLAYRTLADLAAAEAVATEIEANLPVYGAMREGVITAILRLGKIGGSMSAYRRVEIATEKLAVLARITSDLNELSAYVVQETLVPERFILERIIRQWQQLIVEEIRVLGKAEEPQQDKEYLIHQEIP